MADSFVFSMETTPNFSFNLYENVPVGEHTAIIRDVIVEKNKPTAYGLKNKCIILFYLTDIEREFEYHLYESSSNKSKYYSFFKMLCFAIGKEQIDGEDLKGYTFKINISLVPHHNDPDKSITKITDIRKDEQNIGKCS